VRPGRFFIRIKKKGAEKRKKKGRKRKEKRKKNEPNGVLAAG
jgi:hypothetical protein